MYSPMIRRSADAIFLEPSKNKLRFCITSLPMTLEKPVQIFIRLYSDLGRSIESDKCTLTSSCSYQITLTIPKSFTQVYIQIGDVDEFLNVEDCCHQTLQINLKTKTVDLTAQKCSEIYHEQLIFSPTPDYKKLVAEYYRPSTFSQK